MDINIEEMLLHLILLLPGVQIDGGVGQQHSLGAGQPQHAHINVKLVPKLLHRCAQCSV